jgi:hypothetical protein
MALSPCPPKKIKLERYPDPSERGNSRLFKFKNNKYLFKKVQKNLFKKNLEKINYFIHETVVLLYAKQENEEVFHPLHLVPPTLVGLALAVSLI